MTSTPAGAPVLLESLEGGVLVLTLNRPERFNAFTVELHGLLRKALEGARDNPAVRCILLTGAGRAFCAGQDLSDRAVSASAGPRDLGESIEARYNPLVRLLRSLNKPVICAVNGVAAGAGANIAFCCDIVLAAKSARFIQAFSKIGLVPDSGGSWTLPRLIGEARARALILTGDPVSAEQAEQWGMIWKAVDDASLMAEARSLAARFAEGPTYCYGLTKQALAASAINTLDQQLDLERDLQRKAGHSEDYNEGVKSFLEKRAPRFSGRGPA